MASCTNLTLGGNKLESYCMNQGLQLGTNQTKPSFTFRLPLEDEEKMDSIYERENLQSSSYMSGRQERKQTNREIHLK